MKPVSLRKMSSLLLNKPSRILREINSNALMVEWSRHNVAKKIFADRFEMYEH
jgi:hypothetical protein